MNINAQQRRVVEELDRNLLLLASAGTGKTNTLAYRVAHIIRSGRANGEAILCMTFTNKACHEMKERIQSLVGIDAKAVEISTFHSFCYKILREEARYNEALPSDFTIFDEEDCKELWQPLKPARMKDMDFQNLIMCIKEYRSLYDYYSEQAQEDYRKTIERLYEEEYLKIASYFGGADSLVMKEDREQFRQQGSDILIAYETALQAVHGVDFIDLVSLVHRLFKDEVIRERWRSRYVYIAVDEMQDTGELEYRVMSQLWPGNHVLLCGDYFQTIYEWRGSNPFKLLRDYQRDFQPLSIIFYENYRSNRTLFSAAFQTLKAMFPDLVGSIYDVMPRSASQEDGEPIMIHEARSEREEGAYIFHSIQKLPKDARTCVLVRNNRKAQDLSRRFAQLNEDAPKADQRQFMIIDEFKFFRRQEIKDVMAYFKLLINPYDALSAKRIMKRYVKGIGEGRLRDIERDEVRQAGITITDFLQMPIFEEEPYAKLLAALEEGNVIVYDVESTGTDTTKDYIIQIAAIRINGQGEVLDKFERFIKPPKSVGDSEAVHGFSDDYLATHGEEASVVLEAFTSFSKGAVIVGHNVNYDVSILTSELYRHQLGEPDFMAVYDTLAMARRFYPDLSNHKLGYLSEVFPIDHKPSHNAYDDIMATALLLVYMVHHNIVPTQATRMAIIAKYKHAFATIASQMATLARKSKSEAPTSLLAYIMNEMGVIDYYKERHEMARVEYIRDLYRILERLEQTNTAMNGHDRLQYILQLAALTAGEVDCRIKQDQRIPIITIHQAKGSEFDYVWLAGMNEGQFPNYMAVKEGHIDEEKRLFYVALTRAKERLVITYSKENAYGRPARKSSLLAYLPTNPTFVDTV